MAFSSSRAETDTDLETSSASRKKKKKSKEKEKEKVRCLRTSQELECQETNSIKRAKEQERENVIVPFVCRKKSHTRKTGTRNRKKRTKTLVKAKGRKSSRSRRNLMTLKHSLVVVTWVHQGDKTTKLCDHEMKRFIFVNVLFMTMYSCTSNAMSTVNTRVYRNLFCHLVLHILWSLPFLFQIPQC